MKRQNFLTTRTLSARHVAGWKTKNNILLQRDQSLGEMLDQAHFSCSWLCWKV